MAARRGACGLWDAMRAVALVGVLLALLAGGPARAVTKITLFDDMATAAGQPLYGRETRWTNHSLEYHGEAVAQSAVYAYDFMSKAAGAPALATGTGAVEIVRWSNRADTSDQWLDNAKTCYTTMYNEGCRIFNQSFGSSSVQTPDWDEWLSQFANERRAQGDPIVVTIGSGNDPRNTSTFDILPPMFGGLHFFPNYLATSENPSFVQVAGLEDDLSQARWTGYESTYSDRWKVHLAASVKLWAFDAQGKPYRWGNRVGTSFSAPMVAGTIGYLQAYLRSHGLNPSMDQIRTVLLGEAAGTPFTVNGKQYKFPFVEPHTNDAYTRWSEVKPYALDPSLGVLMQFDDSTHQFVYKGSGASVTKEIVRRGVVHPANASAILRAFDAHFKIPGPLPNGWDSMDIGSDPVGSITVEPDGTWAIGGSGGDIWGPGDGFRYTETAMTGDFAVTCRVKSQTNTDPWAKAGVMIREGLAPGARQFTLVRTPGNGVDVQWRPQPNQNSFDYKANAYPGRLPVWLRVQRKGTLFTAFGSPDGVNWSQVGASRTLSIGDQVFAGVAVTAHNSNRISVAEVDTVSISAAG